MGFLRNEIVKGIIIKGREAIAFMLFGEAGVSGYIPRIPHILNEEAGSIQIVTGLHLNADIREAARVRTH